MATEYGLVDVWAGHFDVDDCSAVLAEEVVVQSLGDVVACL